MKHKQQYVRELKRGDWVDDIFKVVHREGVESKKNGQKKKRLCLILQDRTGRTAAVRWDATDREITEASQIEYARVQGEVQPYDGKRQIKVEMPIQKVPTPMNPMDYDWEPWEPIPAMCARLEAHITSVCHPGLKALLDDIFSDPKIRPIFEMVPAATGVHHAFEHGLFQHTLEVADFAAQMADRAAQWRGSDVSRDLAVAGALIHDLGKLQELEFKQDSSCEFTRRGKLLGHTALGYRRLAAKMGKIAGLDEELQDALHHIILSHHGKREHGAAVPPMFPEALIVHMADDLSAKLYIMREAQQEVLEGEFVQTSLLDAKSIYVGKRISVAVEAISARIPVTAEVTPAQTKLPVFRFVTSPAKDSIGRAALAFETRPIAFYGEVAAGLPRDTGETSQDWYAVENRNLNPADEFFLLQIDGQSMIGDGLYPGDKILVRKQLSADNGDIIIAWFTDNTTSVKHFRQELDGAVTLVPSNPDFPAIAVADPSSLEIRGKVVGVARPAAD